MPREISACACGQAVNFTWMIDRICAIGFVSRREIFFNDRHVLDLTHANV